MINYDEILEDGKPLSEFDLKTAAKLHRIKKGQNIIYLRSPTGGPTSPIGRIALAYFNAGKLTLTQRRLHKRPNVKSDPNAVFEYIAQGQTDDEIMPIRYVYTEERRTK